MQSASNKDKLFLRWVEVEEAVAYVANKLQHYKYRPERILAIARGGLVPATMLAYRLNIARIDSLQIETYGENTEPGKPIISGPADRLDVGAWNNPQTLIVDDIWDSGKTIDFLKGHLPEAVYTTLFYRDRCVGRQCDINFPGIPIGSRKWIEFPWE